MKQLRGVMFVAIAMSAADARSDIQWVDPAGQTLTLEHSPHSGYKLVLDGATFPFTPCLVGPACFKFGDSVVSVPKPGKLAAGADKSGKIRAECQDAELTVLGEVIDGRWCETTVNGKLNSRFFYGWDRGILALELHGSAPSFRGFSADAIGLLGQYKSKLKHARPE